MHRALIAVTLALLAAGVAGCGERGAASGDPASLVPASAAVYLELTVRPEGRLRDDALAAAGKLLRAPDGAGRLRELFDDAVHSLSPGASWRRDFAPWVGERAGLWVEGFEREELSVAVIVPSTDQDAARAALRRLDERDGKHWERRSATGVRYARRKDGLAVGLVGDFVVTGFGEAFEETLKQRNGDHLDGLDRYRRAVDALDDDRLGHYYADGRGLIDAASRQDPWTRRGLRAFTALLPVDRLGPVTGAFLADGGGLAIDNVVTDIPDGPLRQIAAVWSGGRADLVRELPGSAWAAFATPRVGEAGVATASSFRRVFSGAVLTTLARRATGLDLESGVFPWVRQVGGFIRGVDESRMDGAVVIETSDDRAPAAALRTLARTLDRQPRTVARPLRIRGADAAFATRDPADDDIRMVVARRTGRVVAADSRAAAEAALDPGSTLGEGPMLGAAEEALDDGLAPTLLLSVPDAIAWLEASGENLADARRYLDTLSMVAVGGIVEGDRMRSRIAVSFR